LTYLSGDEPSLEPTSYIRQAHFIAQTENPPRQILTGGFEELEIPNSLVHSLAPDQDAHRIKAIIRIIRRSGSIIMWFPVF
jgi:hypothetical protein